MRFVAEYADLRRDVDVVDARPAALEGEGLVGVDVAFARRHRERAQDGGLVGAEAPAVEGAPGTLGDALGGVERVVELLGDRERRRLRLAAVVVAREDDRQTLGDLVQTLQHEFQAFFARFGGLVVGVRVREAEGFLRAQVDENRPGADARTRRAPALGARFLGRLGEPEGASFERHETVGAKGDRRGFARDAIGFAVLAHEGEFLELGAQIGRLVGADLLQADDVEIHAADEVDEIAFAHLPVVGRAAVARREADVVRADAQGVRSARTRRAAGGEKSAENEG